jgi:hypothetical protein
MDIVTIRSWKSQYIYECLLVYHLLCDLLEILNFNNIGALLQLVET